MGFMGMKIANESDAASDLVGNIADKLAAQLEVGLKAKGNRWNTDGVENVALTFEAIINPCKRVYGVNERLEKVAEKCLTKLQSRIKRKTEPEFISDYKRMARSLKAYLKEARR